MINFALLIPKAVVQGIPLLYGSTGEILTEKSGNLNLGIPGVMYVGAISGVIGAFAYEQNILPPMLEKINELSLLGDKAVAQLNMMNLLMGLVAVLIPALCCLLGSLLMGLLYCFLTVTLRANQNVTGLAMTTFGVGFGNFFGGSLIKISGADVPSIALSATSGFFSAHLPYEQVTDAISKALYNILPIKVYQVAAQIVDGIGRIFFSYGFLAYLAIIVAVFAAIFLKKTRAGLHLRAVGENPATADSAGINVTAYKYGATCIGCMIAGLGGLYYVMDYACGVWSNDAFGDRGWLAIALVIFTIWKPDVSIFASILFGGLYIIYLYIPTGMDHMELQQLYKMIPYVVTLIVLVITSMRNKRENQPPASLGLPYFREER